MINIKSIFSKKIVIGVVMVTAMIEILTVGIIAASKINNENINNITSNNKVKIYVNKSNTLINKNNKIINSIKPIILKQEKITKNIIIKFFPEEEKIQVNITPEKPKEPEFNLSEEFPIYKYNPTQEEQVENSNKRIKSIPTNIKYHIVYVKEHLGEMNIGEHIAHLADTNKTEIEIETLKDKIDLKNKNNIKACHYKNQETNKDKDNNSMSNACTAPFSSKTELNKKIESILNFPSIILYTENPKTKQEDIVDVIQGDIDEDKLIDIINEYKVAEKKNQPYQVRTGRGTYSKIINTRKQSMLDKQRYTLSKSTQGKPVIELYILEGDELSAQFQIDYESVQPISIKPIINKIPKQPDIQQLTKVRQNKIEYLPAIIIRDDKKVLDKVEGAISSEELLQLFKVFKLK